LDGLAGGSGRWGQAGKCVNARGIGPRRRAALGELLREVIAADRFFRSPRIRRLKAVLDKLDPPAPQPDPMPPPKPPGEPSLALRRKKRR
jgi:hypothetical protein